MKVFFLREGSFFFFFKYLGQDRKQGKFLYSTQRTMLKTVRHEIQHHG